MEKREDCKERVTRFKSWPKQREEELRREEIEGREVGNCQRNGNVF